MRRLAVLAAFLLLAGHFLVNGLPFGTDDPVEIGYDTFLTYVEEGYIEEVELVNGTRVNGTYTQLAVLERKVKGARTPGEDPQRTFTTIKLDDHNLHNVISAYNRRAEARGEAEIEFVRVQRF